MASLTIPVDEGVPATTVLADGGVAAVDRFLAENGWSLVATKAEQLRSIPGRRWTIRHQTRATDGRGRAVTLPVVVEAARRARPLPDPHPAVLESCPLPRPARAWGELRVWAFPYDPELPDLGLARWGSFVCDHLGDRGPRPAAVSCELVRYRPGRRAVLRYTVVRRGERPRQLYGKVLRPHRAVRLYDAVAAIRPSPRRERHLPVLAWPEPLAGGAMLVPAVTGTTLRRRLLDGRSLPSPARVVAVLTGLATLTPRTPPPALAAEERRQPRRLVDHAVAVLGQALPSARDDLDRLSNAIIRRAEGWAPGPLVHGDLYDDQILVGDGYRLGVIDLDDIAVGDAALDAANLCAHLVVMAASAPALAARLLAYRELLRDQFMGRMDLGPSDLAWREALCVLLLATGPLRMLRPDWRRESNVLIGVAVRLMAR